VALHISGPFTSFNFQETTYTEYVPLACNYKTTHNFSDNKLEGGLSLYSSKYGMQPSESDISNFWASDSPDHTLAFVHHLNIVLHNKLHCNTLTSSEHSILAIASDRRIILSSCLTVILQVAFPPPMLSLCLRCVYCSTKRFAASCKAALIKK
jgi:hypothetical protein